MSKTALLLGLLPVLPADRFTLLKLLPVLRMAVLHFHGVWMVPLSPRYSPVSERAGTCLVFVDAGSAAVKQQERGMSPQWLAAPSAGTAGLSLTQKRQGDVADRATAQYGSLPKLYGKPNARKRQTAHYFSS